MNWISKIEIEKIEVGDPRTDSKYPLLHVAMTPHEGSPVEITVTCHCLTAVELANVFRSVAGAIDRWGETAGITKDSLAASVATGALPPDAINMVRAQLNG